MADTPKVRFKGFTDAWEERKVKELSFIATGKSNTQDKVDDRSEEHTSELQSPA